MSKCSPKEVTRGKTTTVGHWTETVCPVFKCLNNFWKLLRRILCARWAVVLQIQLNFLSTCAPTFPSSSDTDKHTCYSLSSCLALTHSLILGIWRVAMQTITKELLLRHWCTESAYFPCTPAFGYSCDDSHHLMRRCFCFISPSWLKRRGNSVVGFWFVFQSSL